MMKSGGTAARSTAEQSDPSQGLVYRDATRASVIGSEPLLWDQECLT